MRLKRNIPFNWSVLIVPIAFVLSLWVVFWVEIRFGIRFKNFGIFPGKVEGLWGILTGPWIHSGLSHLSNNSLPMLFLLAALFYFYKPIALRVFLIGLILTGLTTWIIGRPSWHIGASGLIYMLLAFIFFKGIQSRIYPLVAVALTVVFLYGGLFWYLFPLDPKISWEGHSAGFIIGLLLALYYRKQESHLYETYIWQSEDFDPNQDAFMRQFDEQGQFNPEVQDEENQSTQEACGVKAADIKNRADRESITEDDSKIGDNAGIKVRYTYRSSKQN